MTESKSRREWMMSEINELRRLVALGVNDKEIGDALGRSAKAVANRRCELHMTSRVDYVEWSDDELAILRKSARDISLSWTEIAKILGRSMYACKQKHLETFGRRFALNHRVKPDVPWAARLKGSDPKNEHVAVSNALYLGAVRREFGCETFGALRAYYTSRCELDVPPAYDGYRLTSIYREDSRSYVGSTAAMCESA